MIFSPDDPAPDPRGDLDKARRKYLERRAKRGVAPDAVPESRRSATIEAAAVPARLRSAARTMTEPPRPR